jgi:hypothetical protein
MTDAQVFTILAIAFQAEDLGATVKRDGQGLLCKEC